MRRALVLALSAAALAAPPASAAAESRANGWCSYEIAGAPAVTGGGFTGYFVATFVLWSPAAGDNPVSADVTCTLYELGVVRASFTVSGTGVVAGSFPVTLAHEFEPGHFEVCETIDYTSDDTPTSTECPHGAPLLEPVARPVGHAVDTASSHVPGGRDAVCEALRGLGPAGASGYYVDRHGNVSTPLAAWRCTP